MMDPRMEKLSTMLLCSPRLASHHVQQRRKKKQNNTHTKTKLHALNNDEAKNNDTPPIHSLLLPFAWVHNINLKLHVTLLHAIIIFANLTPKPFPKKHPHHN